MRTRSSAYETHLKDRFGPLPAPALALLDLVRLKWVASETGIEKIILKNDTLVANFVTDPSSQFYRSPLFLSVMNFVNRKQGIMTVKQNNNKLSLYGTRCVIGSPGNCFVEQDTGFSLIIVETIAELMNLAVDIGNTSTKIAFYEGSAIIKKERLKSPDTATVGRFIGRKPSAGLSSRVLIMIPRRSLTFSGPKVRWFTFCHVSRITLSR